MTANNVILQWLIEIFYGSLLLRVNLIITVKSLKLSNKEPAQYFDGC